MTCKHIDVALKRGSNRVRCQLCGDEFPCRSNACSHLDCIVATKRELPDWVGVEAHEALTAEIAIITGGKP